MKESDVHNQKPKYHICIFALILFTWAVTRAGAADMRLDEHAIVDSAGRRVSAVQPFQRIISLYGAHTENLFAMGAQHLLIGVGGNDNWPPAAEDIPAYSYHDDLEKFLAARPDLVLIRPMIARGYAQLVGRLEDNGITVVSLQPASLDQMFVYWRILGRLTGREAAAADMVIRFQQTVARMQELTASIADKKRVYFEAIHDRMRTFAPSAMPMFVLESAGGINVAVDAAPRRGTNIADYGKERILSHAHEIDVFLAQFGPMNRPTRQMIQTEPGFGIIRAIRQDQIYFIDEKLVSRPTMRMLEGICRIGRILYPQVFGGRNATPGFDCRGEGSKPQDAAPAKIENLPNPGNGGQHHATGTQNKEFQP